MSCPQGKRLGIPPSAFCLASEEYRLRVERVYRVLLVQLAAVGTSVTSYRTRDYVPLSLSLLLLRGPLSGSEEPFTRRRPEWATYLSSR